MATIFERPNALKQDHSTEGPGHRLKRIREKLNLTVRDVENASQVIADRRRSQEYRINISRLSEFENHSVVPSIYRIYSLCVIYRQDFLAVLGWYGVALSE